MKLPRTAASFDAGSKHGLLLKLLPSREAQPAELAQYERAVDIAVKALVVLAAESALAVVALREVSDALGYQLSDGVLADAAGRLHAYVEGFDLGEFETFDAALDELRHRLASIQEPVRVIVK